MPIGNEQNDYRQIIKKTSDERYLLTGSRIHNIDNGKAYLHIHNLTCHRDGGKGDVCHKSDQPANEEFPNRSNSKHNNRLRWCHRS